MLLAPALGLAAFVAYGVFSLVDGIIAMIGGILGVRSRRIDWGLLLAGLVSIAIGLFVLWRPILSIGAMALVVAGWMLAVGVGTTLSAIQYRKQIRGEWLLVIAGLLTIGLGMYLLLQPIVAAALLPLLIGIYALCWGVLLLGVSVRLLRRKGQTDRFLVVPENKRSG